MCRELYRAGVDALIVQDLALLRLDLPPIALHASTQCDISTPQKAIWLQKLGFSQIVIARELTLSETRDICAAVTVPVEAFVHGALCVSYSGACYASYCATGRSANRGECAQICRLPYTLTDANGTTIMRNKHLLSLRDLNRLDSLDKLLDAGVSSLKIEGRLKDMSYVKNVVSAYRRQLDSIIDANPLKYCRASDGTARTNFTPALDKSFNRGFTSYFTSSPKPASTMASFNTPKWVGEKIGTVNTNGNGYIELKTHTHISNGDGLGYFTPEGTLTGFRVNRTEGGTRIFPATRITLPPGTEIFRNSDKQWEDLLSRPTSTRKIDITITMSLTPRGIAADARDAYGNYARVAIDTEMPPAKTPQEKRRIEEISKTGDTEFAITELKDGLGNVFVPASTLGALRRDLIQALRHSRSLRRSTEVRQISSKTPLLYGEKKLTFRANIANSLAKEVYTEAGATTILPALEASSASPEKGTRIMTTRYCLRRECGKCLRTPGGKEWAEPLTLTSGNLKFTIQFDCGNCRMYLLS